MGLFSKKTRKEINLPFILIENAEEMEAGFVTLEMYGAIDGNMKYLNASYTLKKQAMYEDGSYEEILKHLKAAENRNVRVELIYKGEKLVNFVMDLNSLALTCSDDRVTDMEYVGSGINDKSERETVR